MSLLLLAGATSAAAAEPARDEQIRVDAGITGSTVAVADRNGMAAAGLVKAEYLVGTAASLAGGRPRDPARR